MTAASPGLDRHHPALRPLRLARAYVMALAREMRKEYELIHARGLLLQVDCPDLAMERARFFQHETARAHSSRWSSCTWRRSTRPPPPSRPTASACTSAGATTTARTPTTCRSRRCCRSSTGRGSARLRCRWPTRATSTSTRVLRQHRAARRDAAPARRHRHHHELRRASRGGGRPDLRRRWTRWATRRA